MARFVFAVDNEGQTAARAIIGPVLLWLLIADNKHTGSMIFPFFLLASKTDKPLGDNALRNQSVKRIC